MKDILHAVWNNQKFDYYAHESSPSVPVLSQMTLFFKVIFNIVFPRTPGILELGLEV
jgi:hypothetical protein